MILKSIPLEDKSEIIKQICNFLVKDQREDAVRFSKEFYPFTQPSPRSRVYTELQMCQIFIRDGFIDRYSGERLLFPGIIRLLSEEFPDIFRYHKNWKMTETHIIYWEMMPTIDHVIPVSRGGIDSEENWVTTSMNRNSAKSNWTLEELNWKLHDPGSLSDWDGLTDTFLCLVEKYPKYLNNRYIRTWNKALGRIKKS